MFDRIETDEAAADSILNGRRDLGLRKVLQQPQNLDVLALAAVTEASLHRSESVV